MDTEQSDPIQALQVMVVDDDRVFRNYIEAQLEMLGCQIVSVESGDAAWPLIQTQPPDLVLLDVFMPGMSGMELCRKIKSSPQLRGIPVVLLTMLGAKVKDEGYQAGADDFLNKPPHLTELRTRLRNLLLLRSLQTSHDFDVPSVAEGELTGPPPRILILESHGILREHAMGILAQENWDVKGVDTQDRLLESLRAERPDVVIIDQDLLEGPGSSLVSRLRSQASTADLTILLMCEGGSQEPKTGTWQSEADEHLIKPFEATELKTRVRSLLKHSELRRRRDAQVLDSDLGAIKDPRSGVFTRPFLYASLDYLTAFTTLIGQPIGLLGYRMPAHTPLGAVASHQVPALLAKQLKSHEVLCRVGEAVFVAILPGADLAELKARVELLTPLLPAGRFAQVTGTGESAASLLKRVWEQLRG